MKCFLTVFNQLTWPKRMAEQCAALGLEVVLLDNGSTYPPLLEWYKECPFEIVRNRRNLGCYGFFRSGMNLSQQEPYVVSDSDLDLSGVPADVINRLLLALDKFPTVAKAGLSLQIDDLPDHNQFKEAIVKWESKFWTESKRREHEGVAMYVGEIGATFALYDPKRNDILNSGSSGFYPAIRLDKPYMARHEPWYLDLSPDTISDELLYYYLRCDNVAHWGSKFRDYIVEKRREAGLPLSNLQTSSVSR